MTPGFIAVHEHLCAASRFIRHTTPNAVSKTHQV